MAGRARVGADVAALGAAITEAAAEMVRLTASGIEMDDLLVTSPANFHVLRVVDGQVAHLVLDRGVANLAMARREFGQMIAARVAPEELPPPAVVPSVEAVAARAVVPVEAVEVHSDSGPEGSASIPEQRADEPVLEGEVLPASPIDLGDGSDLPRLPQRRADAAWQDDPTAYEATVPALPGWLRAAAEGPFTNDSQTLDRVIGGLRRLQ